MADKLTTTNPLNASAGESEWFFHSALYQEGDDALGIDYIVHVELRNADNSDRIARQVRGDSTSPAASYLGAMNKRDCSGAAKSHKRRLLEALQSQYPELAGTID